MGKVIVNKQSTILPENWLDMDLENLACLAPLQKIELPEFTQRGLQLSVKREDLLHPELGGNKLYKLYGHLRTAMTRIGIRDIRELKVASFGGAWSNHIYALAAAGEKLGFTTLGVIRSETADSAMLEDVRRMGMRLHRVSRSDYRRREHADWLRELDRELPGYYWVPEGGGGPVGMLASGKLMHGILALAKTPVDVVAHAVGTATSIAGLISVAPAKVRVVGVAVLKMGEILDKTVHKMLENAANGDRQGWQIRHDFHFGGYARVSHRLLDFMRQFEARTNILLDPVYTAKLLFGLCELAKSGMWSEGTHVVAVHSGGLQGRRGFAL